MDKLQIVLDQFNSWLWGNWLLFLLVGVGILYTIITGAVQIRYFGYIMKHAVIKPLLAKKKDSDESGTISSFQALCTALASCVGSGNIVGVATAVLGGGMGALFWMWFAAFFGMATKYGEIVLGMLYRQKNEEGHYMGGPFYYIRDGLKAPWLAVLCAVFMVVQIIGGNFIQSNSISGVMYESFHIPHLLTGVGLVFIMLIITMGGLQRLARTAQSLVPFMAGLYILFGLVVIIFNYDKLPAVFSQIFTEAFSLRAAGGGATGVMMVQAMKRGVARGLYSNEAGEGSAPVIHSAARVEHPCQQGITGVAEVFIDTFIICSITGLVIGVTGVLDSGAPGSVLAVNAFASLWEPLRYLATFSLILFCTTTLMSQWYFGFVALNYILGLRLADYFKYIFPFFCIIGAQLKINLVWTLQDIALGMLTIPNLIAMLILYPQVRKVTDDFFQNSTFYPHSRCK